METPQLITAEPSALLISLRPNDYFIGFELNKEYYDKAYCEGAKRMLELLESAGLVLF